MAPAPPIIEASQTSNGVSNGDIQSSHTSSNGHAAQSSSSQAPTLVRSERLAGKVAIITGGAQGFGASIAEHYIAASASVVIIDINESAGQAMQAKYPENLHFLDADVTIVETWNETARIALEKFGKPVSTVVNNAGISFEPKPVHELPMSLYDRVFNLNVRPVFLSVQALIEGMKAVPGASFINISSTGYTRPRPGFAFYTASKAAVTTATKTMALEYAPLVRFNAIAPALGNTSMLQVSIAQYADPQARLKELCQTIPMGRPTNPEDVAAAAVYLASDEAKFVTGTLLEVDGGRGI